MTREPFRVRPLPDFDPPAPGESPRAGRYPVETDRSRTRPRTPGGRATQPPPHASAVRRESVLDGPVLGSAAFVALFVLVLSVAQVNGRTVAIPALARLTDGLVGSERLIALHRQEWTAAAAAGQPFSLPGYVVRDVAIPTAAALPDGRATFDETAARQALLNSTAERLYASGPAAFVAGGSGWRGDAGPIRLLVRALSRTWHRETALLAWLLGAVAVTALAHAAWQSSRAARTAALALLLAGAPLLALALVARVLGGFTAPAGEAGAAYRAVIAALAGVPARNALALLGAGIVLRTAPAAVRWWNARAVARPR